MTNNAYICDYIRTPIGRYAGALARVRADDLAALPIKALIARHHRLDWARLDDVVLGCANQAGEDNRNVARMASLLAGLPCTVPGVTVNRLCASGMEAVAYAARTIAAGEAEMIIAGGVESMSRAPLVMPKAAEPFARQAEIHDTTIGWRLVNPAMRCMWGVDSLAETAERLAIEFRVTREAQDRFAAWSQDKAVLAQRSGMLAGEILPVAAPCRPAGDAAVPQFASDEHPRVTTVETLASLKPITRPDGSVTAGNATGLNDGAAALLIASDAAVSRHGLNPIDEVTTAGLGAPAGETQWVRYYYEDEYVHDEDENYSRLVKIRYPDKPSAAAEETELLINYGADNGLDDLISRPIDLKVSNHNGTTEDTIVSYNWVGMGMASIVNYQLVGAELGEGLQLDRTLNYNPASSLDVGSRRFASYTTTPRGTYPGWDRFGRTLVQAWVDGVLDVHASNDDVPNRPPVVLETYSHDRSSNPLTRFDARYGAHLGNRDFAFAYDGLDRLIESDRGHASTWGQTGTQDWTLDMLGNWATFRWDRNGDGDFADGNETDVRAHNSANEIDDRTLEYPSPVSDVNAPVTYDDAGNVRLRYETGTTRLELTHDAWNRLVKVRRITGNIEDPPLDVSRHEYNGLHWRIMSVEDTDTPRDGELDQRRVYFYSANWQVLEEWVEVAHDPDPYEEGLISDYRMQQVWGLRHLDDAVMLRRQEETGEDAGDFTRVSFQLTDRQFSVVAVVDESGMLMERVTYDPYGRAQHRWPGDFNGDGYADSTDTGALAWYEQIGDVDYRADQDLDRSGEIDLDDLIIAAANWSGRGPLGSGQISDPEGPANRVGYAGYRFEPSSALYHVRFRWYDTGLGRWMERDPAGYVDGIVLYQYGRSRPITFADAFGLSSNDPTTRGCRELQEREAKLDQKRGNIVSSAFSHGCFWATSNGIDAPVKTGTNHLAAGPTSGHTMSSLQSSATQSAISDGARAASGATTQAAVGQATSTLLPPSQSTDLARAAGRAVGRAGGGVADVGFATYKGLEVYNQTESHYQAVAGTATSFGGAALGGAAAAGGAVVLGTVGAPAIVVVGGAVVIGAGVGYLAEEAGDAIGTAIADSMIAGDNARATRDHCAYLRREYNKAMAELIPLSKAVIAGAKCGDCK